MLRPEAIGAMRQVLDAHAAGSIADPGRMHFEGMTTRSLIEEARESVARFLGARAREIVFTSSASESIATATWGAVRRAADAGRIPHIVTSAVEHSAVRDSATMFTNSARGTVEFIGVDHTGRVDIDTMCEAIGPDTALASLQWANHEVGTIQPIDRLIAHCRSLEVLVHVDAAQIPGHLPVDLSALDADLVSFSGHKFGAPAGIGVLWVRRGLRLTSLVRGSEQERARRAGLENLLAIAGLAAVAEALKPARVRAEADSQRALTDRLRAGLTAIDGITELGATDPADRLPHLVCVAVAGVEPQGVVLGLDQHAVSAHSGSSCATESLEPSPVLEAMGVDAHRSLRLSVGWNTTTSAVDAAIDATTEVVGQLRSLANG